MRLRSGWRHFTRHQVRDSELALLVLSAALSLVVSAGVAMLHEASGWLHALLYLTPLDGHLSAGDVGDRRRLLLVPVLGGLVYGLIAEAVRRLRKRDVVDPIEANALYGGRMSLGDSLSLTALAMISLGVGASVGMEAGYSQGGAGFASKIGRKLKLRRNDLRTLVGCGAAAAIAAAFNAPLAGAFYALELVVGSYSLTVLAPIGVAAASATLVARLLFDPDPIVVVPATLTIGRLDYLAFFFLGLAAAAVGIVAMRGVTVVEARLQKLRVPRALRPLVGGLVLAGLSYGMPQVLGSGHGAIQETIDQSFPILVLLFILAGKLVASAVSVGCGFRGGLFSSSLFLGSLLGALVAAVITRVAPGVTVDPVTFTLVGMGATGAAVIGAPVTMILLVLEMTGNYPVTLGVLLAVLVASVAVRHWFGYSFATWRFHLRGVRLRGAQDVGWVRELSVGRTMRRDPVVVTADKTGAELRKRHPIGSTKRLFVVDANGAYLGMIDVPMLHAEHEPGGEGEPRAGALVSGTRAYLLPAMPVRLALELFEKEAVEALPVLDSEKDRRVIGFLTEAFALRRYSQELERRRSEELGNSDLFGPSTLS
ncbi:chloride channel protein [Tistlia consotensis]|uniref:chloride channel protein n=1 Tax=Tistlia consotensis TaxID=1321365 RepID=UPI000A163ABB|nr:chloride channel protein [Tistlia consotensis]